MKRLNAQGISNLRYVFSVFWQIGLDWASPGLDWTSPSDD
jgi:hypothetical protein